MADVDPAGAPADPAVLGDLADLEAGGIFELGDLMRVGPVGGPVEGYGALLVEGFVGGRNSLNSWRKRSKTSCWAGASSAGGNVVSSLRVRCMRS